MNSRGFFSLAAIVITLSAACPCQPSSRYVVQVKYTISRILYASFKQTAVHGTIEEPFSACGSSVSTHQMMHCSTHTGHIHDVPLHAPHFKGRQRRDSSDKIDNGPQAFLAVA